MNLFSATLRIPGLALAIVVLPPAAAGSADWSPDGQRLLFWSDWTGNLEVYVINVDGTGLRNLTNHPAEDANPVWAPGGKKIAFYSKRDGQGEIYSMDADGANQRYLIERKLMVLLNPKWSPDGSTIVFHSLFEVFEIEQGGKILDNKYRGAIYSMNKDGSNMTKLTQDYLYNFNPYFSPDAKQVSFNVADENGVINIHIMAANGTRQVNLTKREVTSK